MKIAKAGCADLDELCAIDDEPRAWSRAAIEDEFEKGDAWIARGDRALGFVFVRSIADERWLMRVVVARHARRQGVARRLLEVALDGEVWLEVAADNVAAIALYRSLGFFEVGRRPAYYRDPLCDALVFKRAASES